jgi:hypothetical protein
VKRLLSDNKDASSDGRQLLTEAEYHEALRIENEVLKRTLAQVHMAAGYKRSEESSSGGEDTAQRRYMNQRQQEEYLRYQYAEAMRREEYNRRQGGGAQQ